MTERLCFACGAQLYPSSRETWTSHEFHCAKAHPEIPVPTEFVRTHEQTLVWERRSAAAKRGVETRRRKGGKRAPR